MREDDYVDVYDYNRGPVLVSLLRVAKFNYGSGELKQLLKFSVQYMQRRAEALKQGRPETRNTQTFPANTLPQWDIYRQEHRIMEILYKTGSCHFSRLWGVAENRSQHSRGQTRPRQDQTMIPLEFLPGGRTMMGNFPRDFQGYWEMIFCLSKALSAMAYGSEDPAPSQYVSHKPEVMNYGFRTVSRLTSPQ